jgi:hypothetical protein
LQGERSRWKRCTGNAYGIFDLHTSKARNELKVVLLHLWRFNVKTIGGDLLIFHSLIYITHNNITGPRQYFIYITFFSILQKTSCLLSIPLGPAISNSRPTAAAREVGAVLAAEHHNNPYPTLPAANLSRFSVSPPHPAAAAVEQARKTVTWSLDRHRRHHQYAAAAASEDRKAVKIQVAGWRGARGLSIGCFWKTPSEGGGGGSFMLILYTNITMK